MHIALCGPATLSELQPFVGQRIQTAGYPFPLLSTLAGEYISRGFKVTLVTTAVDIASIQYFFGKQLAIYVVPSRARARDRVIDFFGKERRGIQAALEKAQPDVIHAHWTYEFALAAIDSRVAPVLVTAHDAPITVLRAMKDKYRAVRLCMAFVVRFKTKNLTAVSPYLATRWRKEMLYFRKIKVITNPAPSFKSESSISRERYRVLEVADASRRKNVKTLLKAFQAVRIQIPEATLRLAGHGLAKGDNLAKWAESSGLSDGVIFLGRLNREKLRIEYATASLFCHASLEESQGISLLEAMTADLPIVAGANSGAVSWTLFEGRAGYLTNVSNARTLSEAIIHCLENEMAGRKGGESVYNLVLERFGVEAVVDDYLREYSSLL